MSPRSKKQFDELRDASKEKIMNAALELFGTKGYEATSINQIAKKAEVSKGLMYHYFESKEDLVRQMIDSLSDMGDDMMKKIYNPDPQIFLRNVFDQLFHELKSNFQFYRLITSMSIQIEKFDFVHDLAIGKYRGYMQLFEKLFRGMGYENPAHESRLLAAMIDGIGIQYYIMKDDLPLDELHEALIYKYIKG